MIAKSFGDSELDQFVDGVISRSYGLTEEVRRIEKRNRVRQSRRYVRQPFRETKRKAKVVTVEWRKTVRESRIKRFGRCTSCHTSAISGGSCGISDLARSEEMCTTCYRESRRKTVVLSAERPRKLGNCVTCGVRPITLAQSQTAVYARRKNQCIHCYCIGHTKRERGGKLCVTCGRGHVSMGKSHTALAANRNQQCVSCYCRDPRVRRRREKR